MQRRVNRLALTVAGTGAPDVAGSSAAPSSSRLKRQPREASQADTIEREKLPLPVLALLFSLPLPWVFSIGGFALTPYRVLLLMLVVPCLARWMSGKAGPIRLPDISVILFIGWCVLSICVIHGGSYALKAGGIMFVETVGGYLVGRCYIRSAADFKAVAKCLFLIVSIMMPFAIVESFTGHNVFKDTLSHILPAYVDVDADPRWGMKRVQEGFEHPILFGVFAGSPLALAFLVLGHGEPIFKRWLRIAIVVGTAFFSFSAGPISGLVGQGMLLGWGWIWRDVRAKWMILLAGIGLFVVSVELTANRSLPAIFISMFAFDEWSAYVRILIWRYGTESIANHPLFGVGFGQWDRPEWLPASIDMNWIIDTVRHGLPAGFLLMLTYFSAVITVALKKGLDEKQGIYRTAYVVTMMGFFVVGWTVYLWTSLNVLMFFLLGSGLWLLEIDENPAGRPRTPAERASDGRRSPSAQARSPSG